MNSNLTESNSNLNSTIIKPEYVIREWDFWDYSLLICLIFGNIGNFLSILVMNSKELRNSNTALFVSILKQLSINYNLF
jgi:hypothetical protein